MTRQNKQNILCFLISVSLHCGTKGQFSGVTEQRKFAPKPQPIYNLDETTAQGVITSDDFVDEEKFDDSELRKLFVRKFKLYKNISREIGNEDEGILRRMSRDVDNTTHNLRCLSCIGRGTKKADDDCYEGIGTNIDRCFDTEHCYTELHPQYIKRGCTLPGTLKRTFVCKCPLCNDKPSYDSTYYEYTRIGDWEYDNERLQKPTVGIDLICKVCETTGLNKASDNTCKFGQNADYMVCAKSQLCYTTFDEQSGYVSRGCISKPVYNSMFYLCKEKMCNNEQFPNVGKRKSFFELKYAEPRSKPLSSNAFKRKCYVQQIQQAFLLYVLYALAELFQ